MICRFFALLLIFAAVSAPAHPVAQGTMELTLHPTHIDVHLRVANEQVYVEAAFTGAKAAERLEEAWRLHGAYVLGKLELLADGAPLLGRVEKITPPEDTSAQGFVTYHLRYSLPTAGLPAELSMRQSLLNEIAFGADTRWEATFVVRVARAGAPPGEPQVFTHREPLRIALPR